MAGSLIGRDREADFLTGRRREAADGHGRVVLVAGEAGIGKSRLLRHFESAIGGTRSVCALARCVEFVQTPLTPLRDVLAQLKTRGSARDERATTDLVDRLTPDFRAASENEPLLVGSLFNAIDHGLARHAFDRSVVLIVEDLHWADRSTLAFLSYLADRIERRRMLVVATYRSEAFATDHQHLANIADLLRKDCVDILELKPLNEDASLALVEAALPRTEALAATTIADIVRRSQGNPFFLEELVKGALASATVATAKTLPLSVRGAVLARAALLSDEEREIISVAAVLGERFSVERLVALRDNERDIVLKALERARALGLTYDHPTELGTVVFRHALTQEVLYGELLAERIRPLHETIASELEQRPDAAAFCIELAHHWKRAGNRARAAWYAWMAGDRAFAVGAMADAILYYERALADCSEAAVVANLFHKMGRAHGALDQLGAGIERLRQAGERYWQLGDFVGFAENASALGAQLYNSGDPVAASNLHRAVIAALEPKVPSERIEILRARIAFNCIAALDLDSALRFVSDVREPIGDPLTASHVYESRFKIAAMRGDLERWRRDSELALEAANGVVDGGSRLRHMQCQIALDAVALGEINLARQSFRAAIPSESRHVEPGQSLATAASSFEHTLRGDLRSAARLLEESTRTFQHNFAVMVHVKSAQIALAVFSGELARLRRDETEPFLHHAMTHGMNLALGIVGGPYAWALGMRGELKEAAAWIASIALVLPEPHRFLFAYLAAAQFGDRSSVNAMRTQLERAASRPGDRVHRAALGLFDAFAGRRGVIEADVVKRGLEGADGFETIGWPWLAAQGYEIGGERDRALEIYRRLGAVRDVRRIEMGRPDATAAILSPREREVADLAASGHSNDEIARMLNISLRTVEKHVSSSLRKLNLRSRVQLGLLLARP